MPPTRKSFAGIALLLATSVTLALTPATPAAGFANKSCVPIDPFCSYGGPVHETITADGLSFLKAGTIDDIAEEHLDVDVSEHDVSAYHFDDCNFTGSVAKINELYEVALKESDPDAGVIIEDDAADAFGQLLHVTQDFYAHSNWVELDVGDLFDMGYELWAVPVRYAAHPLHQDIVFVEGDTSAYTLTREGRIVSVAQGEQVRRGLISGAADDTDMCPDQIELSHYDSEDGTVKGLNKDNDLRDGFEGAKILATEQTTHEWCRLVNLTKKRYGRRGVANLFQRWVEDTEQAIAACPSADIALVIDATGSMVDDIAEVKTNLNRIIDALNEKPVIVRLALATYKDFSDRDPYAVNLSFSLDDDIRDAVNTISVYGGGDTPEAVYNALIETVNGKAGAWNREATSRAIILMGDAPAHDPEPNTGYTLDSVLNAIDTLASDSAQAINQASADIPLNVHGITVGFYEPTQASFAAIAGRTGGRVFPAETSSDVVDAIIRAIDRTLNPPHEVYLPLVLTLQPQVSDANNIADALAISSGQQVAGHVEANDRYDVYSIAGEANQQLAITLKGTGGDADLYLFPPGTLDVTKDSPVALSVGSGSTEAIRGTIRQGGTWYILVYAYAGATSYTLSAILSASSTSGDTTASDNRVFVTQEHVPIN